MSSDKVVVQDIRGGYNISAVNNNFQIVADALNDKVLWRDNVPGEPNEMLNDLDMNGKRVYNLPAPYLDHEAARLQDVRQMGGAPFSYFGPLPEDPTARPDGSPLVPGDSYYNTVLNQVRYWNGGSWFTPNVDGQQLQAPDGSQYVGFIQSGAGAVARTSLDKMKEWVSVKDFGAVGDGVTDDTVAFQNALNQGSKDVYVPTGIYSVSSITVNTQKLFGSGTIRWKAGSTTSLVTLTGLNAGIDGITFDGNSAGITSDVVMIVTSAAPYAYLSNVRAYGGRNKCFRSDVGLSPHVRVANCVFHDWGTVSGCNVVDFRSSYGSVVGCHFESIGDGHCVRVGVYNTDVGTPVIGCVVSGSVFRNTQHVGVCMELYARYTTVVGCTFDTLEQGIKIETEGGTAFNNAIIGCTFKDIYQAASANNLNGTRVLFSNNILQACGSTTLGPGGICIGNQFQQCGDAASSQPAIRLISTATNCLVANNYVDNSPFDGIQVGGANSTCRNNRVQNSFRRNIDMSADGVVVTGNYTTGGQLGFVASSAATNAYISGNRATGASTNNFSIVNAAGMYIDATNVGYTAGFSVVNISAGVATLLVGSPVMSYTIDTEASAATDDLDTVTPTFTPAVGTMLMLRSNSSARVVTAKDNTGNMQLAGDFVFTNTRDRLTLVWNGTAWDEVSRSDNA